MTDNVEDFLAHHGVKGMRWGVRKQRRAGDANFQNYIRQRISAGSFAEGVSDGDVKRLSVKGESFVKGTKFSTVTKNPDLAAKGRIFATHLEKDTEFYKSSITPKGGAYRVDFETVAKLTLPSEKERINAFTDILNQKSISVPGESSLITGREYLTRLGYGDAIKSLNNQELGKSFYATFVHAQGSDSALNNAYFNSLKAKGFNAVSDDADKNRFTKSPVILIDPKGTLKVTSVSKISEGDVTKSRLGLNPVNLS